MNSVFAGQSEHDEAVLRQAERFWSNLLTRLDSFIRRLTAQRACLDAAIAMIGGRPGSVLELGLGNGRSFDHLRARLSGRRIVVIERDPQPHPACMPACRDLLVGNFEEILPKARELLPGDLVLVHADIGTGDDARNARLAALVARELEHFLPDGCLLASDQALPSAFFQPLPVPEGVESGRYHLYRVTRPVAAHIMLGTST